MYYIVQPIYFSVPSATVLTQSVVRTSDSRRFRAALRFVVAPSTTIHSSSLANASSVSSAYIPGSAAVTISLVVRVDCPPTVTVTSFVPLVSFPRHARPAFVHDLDDDEYRTALHMMRTQRQQATLLASDPLAELKNACADLAAATATAQCRNVSFVAAR